MLLSTYITTLESLRLEILNFPIKKDGHLKLVHLPFHDQPYYKEAIDETLSFLKALYDVQFEYPSEYYLAAEILGDWKHCFLSAREKSRAIPDRDIYLMRYIEDELDIIYGLVIHSLDTSLEGSPSVPFEEVLFRVMFLDKFCQSKGLNVEFLPECPFKQSPWGEKLLLSLEYVFDKTALNAHIKSIGDFMTCVDRRWATLREEWKTAPDIDLANSICCKHNAEPVADGQPSEAPNKDLTFPMNAMVFINKWEGRDGFDHKIKGMSGEQKIAARRELQDIITALRTEFKAKYDTDPNGRWKGNFVKEKIYNGKFCNNTKLGMPFLRDLLGVEPFERSRLSTIKKQLNTPS